MQERLIKGSIVKLDGAYHWVADNNPIPADAQFIVTGMKQAAQHWKDQTPIETIVLGPDRPFVDIDALNDAIPQKEWDDGLDGNPRPPWQMNYVVNLLNPADASMLTVINSTTGMRIALERLGEKITYMRALSGENVVPVIKLTTAAMKTKFGLKQRPEFQVIEWRQLGGSQQTKPALLGKPVTADPDVVHARMAAAADKLDDSIPFAWVTTLLATFALMAMPYIV